MGTGRVVLGGLQFAGIPNERERNIQTAERLALEAVAQGAQILLTPEVVLTGFVGGDAERAMAEPVPGPSTERFAALAQELGVYIFVGLSEFWEGQIRNALALLSPQGEYLGAMRKVHINRYESPGGWCNGSEFPVWDLETATGSLRAGAMICYDREVPECARILMLQGADVIFNPLACGCPTDDIHRCLLRTRGFENELYVFMVNHAAPSQNGHSFVVDYNGNLETEQDADESVFLYTVDLDALEAHRKEGIYARHHRRPELYDLLTDPAGQDHPDTATLPPESSWHSLKQ
jgi:predicted amidohydrolase